MNAPSIDGKGAPNLFPDPRAVLEAFEPEYPGGIGTRNGVRGEGVFNIDGSLAKRVLIREGHSLQLRWEVFNLTNTSHFDVNSASLDIAVTGTFVKYGSVLNDARVMQFGLRYEF